MLYQLMNKDVVAATYEEEQRLLDYSYKLVEQQDAYLPYGFAGIDDWIDGLESDTVEGWSAADKLSLLEYDPPSRVAGLASAHARSSGLGGIRLDHLWIEM